MSGGRAVTVQRWTRLSTFAAIVAVGVIAGLALVPSLLGANTVDKLTELYVYVIIAAMWNALAGYAGLVSIGQQGYFGLGAYLAIQLTNHDVVGVYPALVLAALIAGAVSLPTAFFALRLRGGEFAIGMWVTAEVFRLLVSLDSSVGGGTGTSLIALNDYEPDARRRYTYFVALGATVVLLTLVFLLLRSRTGSYLRAIRDDEDAATSVGVRSFRAKLVVFVLAAVGAGAAGSIWLAGQLTYQPNSYFGVQWTAFMIFMVLVGGLGTFEGPILGAIVFFVVQDQWGDEGAWYLVGLGVAAIVFSLFLSKGIWGTFEQRTGIRPLPVGYQLRWRKGTPEPEPAREGGAA